MNRDRLMLVVGPWDCCRFSYEMDAIDDCILGRTPKVASAPGFASYCRIQAS
jgi:hypothetical protein